MKRMILGLILMGIVFAASPVNSANEELVKQYAQNYICRLDFYTTLLEDSNDYGLEIEVGEVVNVLNEDKVALEAVESVDEWRTLIKDTIKEDGKQAVLLLKDIKKALKSSESDELREMAKEDFDSAKEDFANCNGNQNTNVAKGQLNVVTIWIQHTHKVAEELEAKGIDSSEMYEVIAQAQELEDKLQDAIDSGDPEIIKQTREEVNREHYLLFVRFHMAKVSAILDALESEAEDKGFTDELNEVKSLVELNYEQMEGLDENFQKEDIAGLRDNLAQIYEKMKELYKNIRES